MARLPRYALPGQPQHIILRGNNRQPIFFADADYRCFLDCLGEGVKRHACDVHAYVLMTNHVHLLATPQDAHGISKVIQSLGRRYVQYVNYRYRRSGTLWEGRFKATPIDSENNLLTCYRYIELNPVRARMVNHPRQYRWSSYRFHAEGKPDPLIRDHPRYLALGHSELERREAYKGLFRVDIDETTLTLLRDATNKGWVLGNDRFRALIEVAAQRRTQPLPKGGKRTGAGRPSDKDKRDGLFATGEGAG